MNLPEVGSTIYLKPGLAYYSYAADGTMTLIGRRRQRGSVVVSGISEDARGRTILLYNKGRNAIYA
jgi:hypothetical protein